MQSHPQVFLRVHWPPGEEQTIAPKPGRVVLFYSQEVLAELTDVARRPKIVQRFGVTDEAVEIFTELIY